MEPTFPLLLTLHNYFADPGCRLENIKAAPGSRILFVSFCRSGGNTNCFDMPSQIDVASSWFIMVSSVTTIYSQGDTILTLWLPSRCRDPWSSRGWSFTRYKDNFVTKKDQVFRLPFKVWVTKSLLMRPLSTLLSRVDISSRVIILSVFFPYSCTSDCSFYLSSTKFWHPHVLAAHTKSQGHASSRIELFDNHLVWEKISWLEWAVVQLWDWGTRRQHSRPRLPRLLPAQPPRCIVCQDLA